jgi:iron complex outermembrane receptor protein
VVNGGEQRHYGVEGSIKMNLIQSSNSKISVLSPFVNFTHSDFTYANHFTIQKSVTSIEDYTGKNVAGVPKWIANAGIDFALQKGLFANVTYNYRDKMPIDGLNSTYAPSYNLLNGKLGYATSLSKNWKLDTYFGVSNITGSKYYMMAFSNQLPDAYTPAPKDAMVFGGIQLKYEF